MDVAIMKGACLIFLICCVNLGFSQNKIDSQGRKQGTWVKYHEDGKTPLYQGQFKDDQPYGEFRYYYPNGNVKIILQHETLKRCYAWYYSETNQVVCEGQYVNMRKDSLWKNYSKEGYLLSQEMFKNNQLNGERRIFYIQDQVETGEIKLSSIETYKDSLLHGTFTSFLSTGVVVNTGQYEYGKMVDEWKTYHPNGVLASTIKYHEGLAYGYSYAYDEEGLQTYRAYWLKGQKLSTDEREKYFEACKKRGIIPEE